MFITHAFFKALLFLSAGVVIDALERRARHLQDGRPAHAAAVRLLDVPDRRRRPCRPAGRDRGLLQQGPHHRPRAAVDRGRLLAVDRRPRRLAAHRPLRLPGGLRRVLRRGAQRPAARLSRRLGRAPAALRAGGARRDRRPDRHPARLGPPAEARRLPRARAAGGAAAPRRPRRRPVDDLRAGRRGRSPASASPGCSTSAAARRRAEAQTSARRALLPAAAGASTGSTTTPSRCRSCGSRTSAATTCSSRRSHGLAWLTRAGWRGLERHPDRARALVRVRHRPRRRWSALLLVVLR